MPGPSCRAHILGGFQGIIGKHAKRRDAFPKYDALDGSCPSGPRKAQWRKLPEARVARVYELSDARAGYTGGALHIRDQLHLVPGKLGEGQAHH